MSKSKKDIDYKNIYFSGMIFTFVGVVIMIASRNSGNGSLRTRSVRQRNWIRLKKMPDIRLKLKRR